MRHFGMMMIAASMVSGCAIVTSYTSPERLKEQTDAVDAAMADAVAEGTDAQGNGASAAVRPPAGARTAAALDTTTQSERAAAVAPPAAQGALLGRETVALGDPTDPGLWVKTTLVGATMPGRVTLPGGGSVQLELRPLAGSGSPQISLAALRLLGVSLTALTEVEVYRR